MKLNSTDHCGCDNHGHCIRYNESSYQTSEVNFHKSWRQYRTLQRSQVCQCDPGWTGYGDFGLFQHEALLNCATNITFIKAAWALGTVAFPIMWVSAIRSIPTAFFGEENWGRFFFVRPMLRIVGTSSGLYLSMFKTFSSVPDWERAIVYSPLHLFMVISVHVFMLYEAVEAEMKQLRRFVVGALRDFGLVSNREQKRIRFVGSMLKLYLLIGALFFAIFAASTNEVLWSLSIIIALSQTLVVYLVNALYIKPHTFRRLLRLLNNMVKNQESVKMKGDYQALQLARDELKEKLLAIQKTISIRYRSTNYQTFLTILTNSPLCFRVYWKFASYIAIVWTLYSVAMGTVIVLTFLRIRRKKKNKVSNGRKRNNSSSASAFQSSCAPTISVLNTSKGTATERNESSHRNNSKQQL